MFCSLRVVWNYLFAVFKGVCVYSQTCSFHIPWYWFGWLLYSNEYRIRNNQHFVKRSGL